jgi:DNA-binding NtrC family response regulator
MSDKVLLVDDEQDFLDALAQRMRSRGMEVTATTSAEEALAKVAEESFDAIILDLMMPKINGLTLLKSIKEERPELQVILLTGFATVEKGIEAMKSGAVDFVEKPADVDQLTAIVQKAKAQKMILVEKQLEDKIKKIIQGKGW